MSDHPKSIPAHASRRAFLRDALGIGAAVGLGSVVGGCADGAKATVSDPTGERLDPEALGLPYRQDDPTWGGDLMWDRDLVIQAATELEGMSAAAADALLRKFKTGNSIGNEGCQLTCFAMILALLAPYPSDPWTPRNLNVWAHKLLYYTKSGLSMTTLFADLLAEVTDGDVQLCLKEEYLPGVAGWPQMFCDTSALVRAYRSLAPEARSRFLVMIKMGTYDDTVASHYALLHPNEAPAADDGDPLILDPAKPLDNSDPWHMSDCAATIKGDRAIANAWARDGIADTQLGGVWVFSRWSDGHAGSSLDPLIRAWADQLAQLAR